jgi:hypothetical protein
MILDAVKDPHHARWAFRCHPMPAPMAAAIHSVYGMVLGFWPRAVEFSLAVRCPRIKVCCDLAITSFQSNNANQT